MTAASKVTAEEFTRVVPDLVPIVRLFPVEARRLDAGYAEIAMPYRDDFVRPGGTVTGPAIMTLADITMYALVMSMIGRVELAVTTNLNTAFLRRPEPRTLVAKGRMLKLGRRLAFGDIPIYSEDDPEPVAHATVTYSIPPRP